MDQTLAMLNGLNSDRRLLALEQLACREGWQHRAAPVSDPLKINLHAHTIFSYNGYGYSPAYLAWLARSEGWYALGTVDFDVLDSVDESLAASEQCGIRGTAGFETRVYVPDRSGVVLNSPGEPGVMYFVGMGFGSGTPAPQAGSIIDGLRDRAQSRNQQMIARINAYMAPVAIDYEQDVLPLTPSGNATERHMLIAYDAAARKLYPGRSDLLRFWSDRLGLSVEAVDAFLTDTPFPHDTIRAKLMKQGGPGYMAPTPDSFPPLEDAIAATEACGALPCYPFVDGTSTGEQDMRALLTDLVSRGIVAMVLIPDRNWNVQDTARSQDLVERMNAALQAAERLDLPVFIGTEMNKPGQLLIDDLSVPALHAHSEQFKRGADMLWAHTVLERHHGLGFQSAWARAQVPSRAERAHLYTRLGSVLSPADGSVDKAASLLRSSGLRAAVEILND